MTSVCQRSRGGARTQGADRELDGTRCVLSRSGRRVDVVPASGSGSGSGLQSSQQVRVGVKHLDASGRWRAAGAVRNEFTSFGVTSTDAASSTGPPRDRRPPVDTLYCSYLRHWCSRVGSPNENKLVLLQLHVCSHQFTASQCLNWCYWWDSGRLVLLVLVLVLVLSWLDQLRRFPANKELGSVRAAPLNFTHSHFDPLTVLQSDWTRWFVAPTGPVPVPPQPYRPPPHLPVQPDGRNIAQH